jgi:hypothetical protein
MSAGSVYILQNSVLPEDMLKIGRTERNAQERAKELFTTGLPEQFNICYERDVPDCALAEKLVHQRLKKYRYRTHLRSQEVAASRFSISLTKQRLILVVA